MRHELDLRGYAYAIFQRERVLDNEGIVARQISKGFFRKRLETEIQGNLEEAWSSLKGYAETSRVPFVAGDLDATNRVPDLERQIRESPEARAAFRQAYAFELVHHQFGTSTHAPLTPPQEQRLAELLRDEALMNNPFVPVSERRPGMVRSLAKRAGLSVG